MSDDFYVGKKIEINNIPIYTRYCSISSEDYRSGTFYLWEENIKNNRIRITNNPDNAGKYGFVTGWINVEDLYDKKDKLCIGDKVYVNGNINSNPDGTGNKIKKINSIMYIIKILDSNEYEYNYAVSTAMNRTNQGWAKEDILNKIKSGQV